MSLFSHFYFILNEHSTHGSQAERIIHEKMQQHKITSYQIHKTTKQKDGQNILARLVPSLLETDLIVAVGGDGTLSEVVNGMEAHQVKLPVAFIPTGSGNDFARNHHIPITIPDAMDHLFELKKSKTVDVLKIRTDDGTHYAVNSCGIGIDGRVIHSMESAKTKKNYGKFSYLYKAFSSLFQQKKFDFTISIDGRKIEVRASLLNLIANHGYFGGGVHIHPEADAEDGLMDVLFVENVKFIDLIVIIFKLLINQTHLSHKKVHTYLAKKVEIFIHSEEYSQADGEVFGFKKHHHTYELIRREFWI